MTKVELDHEEEDKPLDPEMEKVRRKMVRLLVVSIGIMILGVMAVLAGVVYRVIEPEEAPRSAVTQPATVPSDAPRRLRASLPPGFAVEQVALDGPRILFYGRKADGGSGAVILDIASGAIVSEIDLQ